ncbi:hypothetical protein, partial [Polaribacter sp.]|uniref:hypothetical protein n=1 Tax=Polaribacter sp. TaxID=1920175 RepID=UPI003F6CE876
MDARVEVEIGADVKELQNKLARATKLLDGLKSKNKELAKSFDAGKISSDKYYSDLVKNNLKISKASKLVTSYKNSVHGLGNTLDKGKKSIISGDSALTSFSRTIQDAPFGIMGVSNNITNLTEQFGYLKAKTGSSGSALKAMLSSLKGFGGISLAISVATSALLVFGDKIFDVKNNITEFNDSLKDMSTSSVVEFKTLTDVMTDTTASQTDQKRALELLKEKYSDFDTSVFKTKGNLDEIKKSIDEYTIGLIQNAKAKAGLSLIEEKFRKKILLEDKRMQKMRASFGANSIELFEKRRKRLLDLNNKQLKDNEELRKKREKQINERFDSVKNMGAKEIQQLEIDILRLNSLANVRDEILFGGKGKKQKETDRKPVFIDFKLDDSSFEALETIDLGANDWIGDSPFNWEEYFKLKDLDTQKNILNEKMLAVNAQMSNLIQGQLANTFSGIGQAIGNGLSQGTNVLAAVGGALISGIGNLIGAMGDKLIQL